MIKYLFICIGLDEPLELVRRFLEHYRALGVERFGIVAHSEMDGAGAMQALSKLLAEHGCTVGIFLLDHSAQRLSRRQYRG